MDIGNLRGAREAPLSLKGGLLFYLYWGCEIYRQPVGVRDWSVVLLIEGRVAGGCVYGWCGVLKGGGPPAESVRTYRLRVRSVCVWVVMRSIKF